MNRARWRQGNTCLQLSLLGLGLSLFGFSIAQELDLQASVDEVNRSLQELDDRATACLSALDSGGSSEASCDDFIAAVDGELMANYLQHCNSLKTWRDDFVALVANEDTDIENTEAMLEMLVAVEYGCGQNALQNRTQNVVAAFAELRDGRNSQANALLLRRLAESEFTAVENRGRQSLQDSVQQQQFRRQMESQRQSDSLELELIRQQIRSSNPFD